MRQLRPVTCAYLLLPYLVFLAGWLRTPAALAIGALCAAGLAVSVAAERRERIATSEPPLSGRELAWTLLPALAVTLWIGVGGVGWQDADWLRGNAVFRDLVQHSWPVAYDTEAGPLLLVYYIAFYLPAAAVGKLFGWQAANLALFVYGGIGISLASLWVTRLAGVRRWWVVPVFLAFSGMDVIGAGLRSLFETLSGDPEPRSWRYVEWWVGYGVACLPSNPNLLVFAPNQALPAWLLSASFVQDARDGRLMRTVVLWGGICTLWAPFVTLGLVPFAAAYVAWTLWRERTPAALAGLASGANFAGLLLGLVAVAYLAVRFHPYVLPIDTSDLYQEEFTLTLFRRGPAFLFLYPIFVALEFGLLHALLYGARWRRPARVDGTLGLFLVTSTVVLCILPWINLGWNNDLVMRASIPMLFVTAIVTLRALALAGDPDPWVRRFVRGIALVLAIGALNSALILGRHIEGVVRQRALVAVPAEAEVADLFELQRDRYIQIGFNFVGQYLGSPDSPVARHLLAPASPE